MAALPTLVWADSWEHGMVTAITNVYSAVGTTQSISTGTVKHGTRSLRINPTAASGYVTRTVTGDATQSVSFYWLMAATPANGTRLAEFNAAAGGAFVIQYNSASNKLELAHSAGTGTETLFGPTLSTATWYRLTFKFNCSANPWTMTGSVNGANEASITDIGVASSSVNAIRMGTLSSNTKDFFYDSLVVSSDEADYDFWKPREHVVEGLIVNGDGTHSITTLGDFDSFVGTAFNNSTTTGSTFIDHRPFNRTNTADDVIRQELGTTSNYMEFTIEDRVTAGIAVGAVGLATHVESATSGASLAEVKVVTSGGTALTPSIVATGDDPGTTVTTRAVVLTAPSGGWGGSVDTVTDGLKVRMGFGDNAPDVNFIDFMLQLVTAAVVEYTPAVAADAAVLIATAGEVDAPPQTFERAAAVDAAIAIDSAATFYSIFERSTAADAAVAIATASTFFTTFERAIAADAAVAAGVTAFNRDHLRATATDAAVLLATSGTFWTTFERATATDIAVLLAAAGEVVPGGGGATTYERAASIDAAIALDTSATFYSILERAVAADAAVLLATSGTFWTTFERQSALDAAVALTAAFNRDLLRATATNATVGITTASQKLLLRAAAINALIAIATGGEVEEPFTEPGHIQLGSTHGQANQGHERRTGLITGTGTPKLVTVDSPDRNLREDKWNRRDNYAGRD